MNIYSRKGRVISSSFMLASASLGLGIFGLAVSGELDLLSAFLLVLLGMVFSIASGLLWAETFLAVGINSHFYSATRGVLGKVVGIITAISFIIVTATFLIYNFGIFAWLIHSIMFAILQVAVPPSISWFVLSCICAICVFFGVRVVDRINFVCFVAFLVSLPVTLLLKDKTVSGNLFQQDSWIYMVFMVPVISYAFFFQFILPSVINYLDNQANKIRHSIVIAMTIVFFALLFWQFFLLESVPDALFVATFEYETPVLHGIRLLTSIQTIRTVLLFLITFVVFSSSLLTSLSLTDFMHDWLGLKKKEQQLGTRSWIILLTILPTCFIGMFYLRESMQLIRFIHPWAMLLLGGIMPLWLVLNIRFNKKITDYILLPFGRISLIIFAFITFLFFYLQGANLIWSP